MLTIDTACKTPLKSLLTVGMIIDASKLVILNTVSIPCTTHPCPSIIPISSNLSLMNTTAKFDGVIPSGTITLQSFSSILLILSINEVNGWLCRLCIFVHFDLMIPQYFNAIKSLHWPSSLVFRSVPFLFFSCRGNWV